MTDLKRAWERYRDKMVEVASSGEAAALLLDPDVQKLAEDVVGAAASKLRQLYPGACERVGRLLLGRPLGDAKRRARVERCAGEHCRRHGKPKKSKKAR